MYKSTKISFLLFSLLLYVSIGYSASENISLYKRTLTKMLTDYLTVYSGKHSPLTAIVLAYLDSEDMGWITKNIIQGDFKGCHPYSFDRSFFLKQTGISVMYNKNQNDYIHLFNMSYTEDETKKFAESVHNKASVTYLTSKCGTLRLKYIPSENGEQIIQQRLVPDGGCTLL